MGEQRSHPRIVVGADGKAPSVAALRWAVPQAEATGAVIDVVTGWQVPATILVTRTYTEGDYMEDARQALERTVDEALVNEPVVHIGMYLVPERPALALTRTAEDADLLVVGGHGRDFPGMRLGSVASYCVRNAPCPVVVVRGTFTEAQTQPSTTGSPAAVH
ncbi:universal stress protein [Parafrankia sp. FMc2]|uniref:universal stress protein n=1 Tax=Parafrankia sp. FMc2 TaxID=3233196 RepID=UPI0034D6EA00